MCPSSRSSPRCSSTANDPAFQNPTKPIGPFYTKDVAERYRDLFDWVIVDDASRGYRRVVSSPEPKEIIELDAIRACVDRGLVVIAGGGGGIPVFNDHDLSKGVEAVIDKDHTSAILASQLGADMFVDLHGCGEGLPGLQETDPAAARYADRWRNARTHLAAGQFPPGSMGPKINAAMIFVCPRQRGEAIITNHEHLIDAVHGTGGTRVLPDPDT